MTALEPDAAAGLLRSTGSLAGAVRPAEVVRALGEAAVPALADWCAVHVVWPGETTVTVTTAHRDPAAREAIAGYFDRYPPVVSSGAGAVMTEGVPLLLADIDEPTLERFARDPDHLRAMRDLGARSAAVLPLTARGRVLGALTLVFSDSGRRYGDALVADAETLAAQAALVLDNARLYAEQEEVARTLQRSLLPDRLPVIDGVDLAVRYRPAGRANEIGGDFYDVVETADGAWRVVVGDIAGKGAEAAALTSLVRHTLAAAALRDPEIADDLELANTILRRRSGAARFCTAAYAEVRLAGDGADLCVLTAGHPPALVVRAAGGVEALPSSGPVLGVLQDVAFVPARTRLGPGDLLVLYTDGAIELRGMTAEQGERELRRILEGTAGCPAAEVLERVERHALVAGGGAPRDDLALLALAVPG